MLRKIFSLILVCILAFSVLSACGEEAEETPETTVAAETIKEDLAWNRDAKGHWQVYEDGTKSESEPHKLDELNVCILCGSEVWDFADFICVYDYDEYGNQIRYSDYGADGKLQYETRSEFEYDENGNCIKDSYYVNGVLNGVNEYVMNADGEMITATYTGYNEGGTKSVHDYDDAGNLVEVLTYEADGSLWSDTDYEYKADADGVFYTAKETTVFSDGTVGVYEYNEQGDWIFMGEYDADGAALQEDSFEYTYDEEGRKMGVKEYSFGALTREVVKGLFVEEDGWWTYDLSETVYNEDGTKTVYEYNENEELVKTTNYDANGNIVE